MAGQPGFNLGGLDGLEGPGAAWATGEGGQGDAQVMQIANGPAGAGLGDEELVDGVGEGEREGVWVQREGVLGLGSQGQGDGLEGFSRLGQQGLGGQREVAPGRIQSEVMNLPAEYNEWVRISLPCFMDFSNPAFRLELRRFWDRWPFDVLVIDNMTDVAKADAREDYSEALQSIRASLPVHPDTPAIVLLAHMRKSRGGEAWKPKRGRELLDELSGSFALGAKARSCFFLQPASPDMDDDRVIFDCGKSNNDRPLPMSAWIRANGEFKPCPDFDFDGWIAGEEDGRKVVTEEVMSAVFHKHGPAIAKGDLVKLLQGEEGFSQATAYRAVSLAGKFKDHLWETPLGLLAWK
jgi:CheY-like chemotaxis protein